MEPEPWPLWRLTIRSPRLELRPDDDTGLLELAEEARRGVHDPAKMPFGFPWTDAPDDEVGGNLVRHYWQQRSTFTPRSWGINFLIRLDGRVIGTQGLNAENFATLREVHTGSWIGRRHQDNGIGTEMRAALLLFAFDHLGAEQARSDVFADNVRSRRVSEKLGYIADGTRRHERRGECDEYIRMLATPERFVRPDWDIEVRGLAGCEPLLVGK